MKKYRFLFITLGVIVAVFVILAAMVINLHNAQLYVPVSMISDGSNGAIIAWQNKKGLYVQHIDSSGQALWQKGGSLITDTKAMIDSYLLTPTDFNMVSDGSGGAIIAWASEPANTNSTANFAPLTIYVQRISSDGKLLWDKSAISTGDNWEILSDGSGGVIIAWDNFKPYYKALHDDYLYLQKIAHDGTRLWGNTGVTLVTSSPFRPLTEQEIANHVPGMYNRSLPTYTGTQDIITDGDGGVIVIWEEEGEQNTNQVFAQRVDSQGNPVWTQSTLVGNGTYQYNSLHTDGSGGAFLALQAKNQGVTSQVQVGQNGGLLGSTQYFPYEISDGSGGSINSRIDLVHPNISSSLIYDILYVQRLDAGDLPVWPEKEVFSSQLGYQIINLQCTTDNNGGIFLSWQLEKGEVARGVIYAQRVDATGNILFGDTGTNVFGITDTYQGYDNILSDNSGGIFVVAPVSNGAFGGNKVYVQHINDNGDRLWGTGIRIDQ